MAFAEANDVVLIAPGIRGWDLAALDFDHGNNATASCNAGTPLAGNCKEVARGCWDGYGQLGADYVLQSAPHMRTVWRMVATVANLSGALTPRSPDAARAPTTAGPAAPGAAVTQTASRS